LPRLLLNPLARRLVLRDGIPIMRGAFPSVGHLPALFGGMLEFVRAAERDAGPLFWVDLGFGNKVLCHAHRDAWDLFKNKSMTSAHVLDAPVELLGAGSLIGADGPAHARVRGALNPTFSPSGITSLELGPAFADMITARLATWPSRGTFGLLGETREMVLALMFRMMGVSSSELSEWRHHYERTMYLVFDMPDIPGSPRWIGKRSRRWLDGRIRGLLADARARPSAPGLLNALVGARDAEGQPLEEGQLVDNLRLILLAGHETSASTMAWATAVCATRDDVWSALCEEALAASDVPRAPAELKAFPYAEALFRESLRMYPPVPLNMRRVSAPLELAGRSVPVGADMLIPVLHLGRDATTYPEPDRFDPERWIRKRTPPSPAELGQFGSGPHFCMGYHVAWMEIVQYLVALARVLAPKRLRPRLAGRFPEPRYIPLMHPAGDPLIRIS
jgi:cytochrome P450